MNKYIKHFLTITKHKWIVFKECAACGIPLQGLAHDISKYGFTEFVSSAKHFQGNRSPIEAEKEDIGYSKAWLHHKSHNKHHWEYWTDFDENGNVIPVDIPTKYVIEMVCDWIGAGKVYSEGNWDQHEVLKYYSKVRKGRYFTDTTECEILFFLIKLDTKGLKAFHQCAKAALKRSGNGR